MRARWRKKYSGASSLVEEHSTADSVDRACNFETALDESIEEAGMNFPVGDSFDLHDSLRSWEFLSEQDEALLEQGHPLHAFEPPRLPVASNAGADKLEVADKSEPVTATAVPIFEHRSSAAPPAPVSEAVRLTEKKPLRFPWEKGRLGRIFGD